MKSFLTALLLSLPVPVSAAPQALIDPSDIVWQFTMNDVDGHDAIGLGQLTLENGGTLSGYMIVRAGAGTDTGFFMLEGGWGLRTDGKIDAFLSGAPDPNCWPDGTSFEIETLHGAAKDGKKGATLDLDGKASGRRISIDGNEAAFLDDISNDFTSQTKKAPPGEPGEKFAELITLSPSVLGLENLYDVAGGGVDYSLFGCALLGRNGRLALTAQQDDDDSVRTLLGKASTKKSSLDGSDDSDNALHVTMVMK